MSGREGNTLSNSVAEEWSEKDSHWFYQLEDNSYIANEWKQINGTWYRFDNSGLMKTGWVKDNDTWYYLDNSGAMKTGWFTVSGKWYYAYSSGALAVDTTVDGYTVNANGEWV